MTPMMRPLAQLATASLARVRVLFTDIDGTLTTDGKLLASTYASLWKLADAGIAVVPVTGRTAGWAEAFARTWPVHAVVAENGGVIFEPTRDGHWRRWYARPAAGLAKDRARLLAAAAEVARAVPGARLSSDSRYAEVDLAIDYNEEARLGPAAAAEIERILRARGLTAVRSSVHVNFWIGRWNKLTACRRVLAAVRGLPARAIGRAIYVGDSVNDEPMFAGFPLSIGVANVKDVMAQLDSLPAYVTRRREGRGFDEIASALLRAHKAV